MDHVWRKIDELRVEFKLLKEDRTPIDVFTFFEAVLVWTPSLSTTWSPSIG